MALRQKSPNVWNVGDEAYCDDGGRKTRVHIVGFRDHLVRIEHPDGSRRMRPHGSLSRE